MKSMNLKSSLVAAALLLLTVQVPAATATDSYQDMRGVCLAPRCTNQLLLVLDIGQYK